MVNLLKETLIELDQYGKFEADVKFACCGNQFGTWDDFKKIADFNYDNGYGSVEVSRLLKIVFKDGSWLERWEYDGAECWVYKETPNIPEIQIPLTHIEEIF